MKGGNNMITNHTEQLRQIGLNIAYCRKLRGLTQLQLAERTGLSRTHISNLEASNMRTSLSIGTLLTIAEALDIPPAKLFEFFG